MCVLLFNSTEQCGNVARDVQVFGINGRGAFSSGPCGCRTVALGSFLNGQLGLGCQDKTCS